MRYQIEIRTIWEFGQRKDENGNPHQEDCIFPAHKQQEPTDRLFVLCDGMGGHAAGEVASATVCDAMSKSMLPLRPVYSAADMAAAVTAAYDALDAIDHGSQGKSKMGTTMTCLALHEGGATIAHMGDSRVYHIRPGKEREDTEILFQTHDHSLVNDLVAAGEITPEEALVHPRRNVITRALQPHVENRQMADIKTTTDVRAGDWFYLCSDGMLEQMDDSAIRFIFSDSTGDIDSKAEMLTQATRENKDNHTAILVHVVEVEDPLPAEKGCAPDAVPPLMGTIEEAPHAAPQADLDNDKSTEVSLSPSSSGAEGGHKGRSISQIKRIALFLMAALIVLAGVYFVRRQAPRPVHNDGTTEAPAMEENGPAAQPVQPNTNEAEIEKTQAELKIVNSLLDSLKRVRGERDRAVVDSLMARKESLCFKLKELQQPTKTDPEAR